MIFILHMAPNKLFERFSEPLEVMCTDGLATVISFGKFRVLPGLDAMGRPGGPFKVFELFYG